MKALELFLSPALVQSAGGGGWYPAVFAGGDRAWGKHLQLWFSTDSNKQSNYSHPLKCGSLRLSPVKRVLVFLGSPCSQTGIAKQIPCGLWETQRLFRVYVLRQGSWENFNLTFLQLFAFTEKSICIYVKKSQEEIFKYTYIYFFYPSSTFYMGINRSYSSRSKWEITSVVVEIKI